MIQLNLLPDIKKEVIKAQKTRTKVTLGAIGASLIALGILVVSVLWVYVAQPIRIDLARKDIEKNTALLRQNKDSSKYLTLQNQLAALPDLHGGKTKTSRLMSILPILNPNEPHRVQLNSVTMSANDTSITVSGRTATFEALNVFTDTLKHAKLSYVYPDDANRKVTEQLFSTVSLQGSSLVRDGDQQIVSFTIRAVYSTEAFSNKVSNVVVSVPTIADAKSVDQTTRSLFEEVEQ